MNPDWLRPAGFPRGTGALMSTRGGGVSAGPWSALNLATSVGDAPSAVAANRHRFGQALGAVPVYLEQVHGTGVVRIVADDAVRPPRRADASFTTKPGVACTVLVADCLPVLLAAPGARGVAAAHAGWRGLAGGVIEATVGALCEATQCAPAEVHAWLGASIGPRQFEVGADVLEAFGAPGGRPSGSRFVARTGRSDKWLADLPGLALDRLRDIGVTRVVSCGRCTVEEPSSFFSFRRDGVTGRMAAAIWLLPREAV